MHCKEYKNAGRQFFYYIFIQIDKFFPTEDNEFVCFLMYLEKHWSWEAGCLARSDTSVIRI